jgi:hypothetical protein
MILSCRPGRHPDYVRIPTRENLLAHISARGTQHEHAEESKEPLVSHPTPLHPDADLAVFLDDLRQSVAAWGDEGMVMRVFRAGICLALLSILDTLIDLLADFRAGRLPPVLPAYDEPESHRRDQTEAPLIAAPPLKPEDPAAAAPKRPAARHARAPGADAPCDAPSDAPEPGSAEYAAGAPRRPIFMRVASRRLVRRPESAPRGIAGCPLRVPRPAFAKSGAGDPRLRTPSLLR